MNPRAPEMAVPGPGALGAMPLAPFRLRAPQWPGWRMVALLSACVFAIYLPGLIRTFDYHDSFYYFAYVDHLNCAAHPQAPYQLFAGRPLLVLLNCAVAGMIDTV